MTAAGGEWRGAMRRLSLGLPTLFGLKRRGFFIPYRYADTVPEIPAQVVAYPALKRRFDDASDGFRDLLGSMQEYGPALQAIGRDGACKARWDQDWFPRLDAAAAYTLTRLRKPVRIVEIGSGHSTRFFARAIADEGLDTAVTAIDPAPRADISALPRVTVIRDVVQKAGRDVFAALRPGDFLSVDSSHILMPGTDVDLVLNEVLAALPAGVAVHFHDIFLPWPYPQAWAWREYNEQQGVAALLAGSRAWRPLWSSAYASRLLWTPGACPALDALPLTPGAPESSLWLVKES